MNRVLRLEDADDRISSLAKLFFHELAKKGNNPVYNLLPDILGKLSNNNLKRESFCNIMQYLIGSIKKDKQMEALVEKLCNRFSGVTDCRQWEYISYCLSQLSFTEKGMKKLMEAFKTYEHTLSEDTVMDNFKNILNKAKKFAKPELKLCIDEFEEKLVKFHIEKKEQERATENAQTHHHKINNLEKLSMARNRDGHAESLDDDGVDSIVDDGAETIANEGEESTVGEGTIYELEEDVSGSNAELDEHSQASSEVTEMGPCESEAESPFFRGTGTAKSKATKSRSKSQKGDSRSSMTARTNNKSQRKVLSDVTDKRSSNSEAESSFVPTTGTVKSKATKSRIKDKNGGNTSAMAATTNRRSRRKVEERDEM